MTPAGTSNELDVQNEREENTHTHARVENYCTINIGSSTVRVENYCTINIGLSTVRVENYCTINIGLSTVRVKRCGQRGT